MKFLGPAMQRGYVARFGPGLGNGVSQTSFAFQSGEKIRTL